MEHLLYQVFWSSFKKIRYSQHTAWEVSHCTLYIKLHYNLSTSNHSLWTNQTLPYFCMKNKTGTLTGKRWNKKLICTLASHFHASVSQFKSHAIKHYGRAISVFLQLMYWYINVCLHISFQTAVLYLQFVWWISQEIIKFFSYHISSWNKNYSSKVIQKKY